MVVYPEKYRDQDKFKINNRMIKRYIFDIIKFSNKQI